MKITKNILLISILFIFILGFNYCKKNNENLDLTGIGLLLLLQQSNQEESSGFVIKIPDGVAK
ncbi:MAG: hypothetical protein KatS3mg129_0837 [Leptospiraceae bacterium]|nr:MAG: hypothetical protein KatS3mg129_0837 [Leptospiraceae bacterium]